MGTNLTYQIATNPTPFQASAAKGQQDPGELVIMATNGGKSPVAINGVQISLPRGGGAAELTANVNVSSFPAAGWAAAGINLRPEWIDVIFHPNQPGYELAAGASMHFGVGDIQVNREPGTFPIVITEQVNGCEPPDCPATTIKLSKWPSGWAAISFSAHPANIPYGMSTRLRWVGPSGALYKIAYTENNQVIEEPTADEPPFSNVGQYPASTAKPLTPADTTTYTLYVKQTIDGQHYHASVQANVTVSIPAPEITCFAAQLDTKSGYPPTASYSWTTTNATYTALSADETGTEHLPNSPVGGSPLPTRAPAFGAHLTAVNSVGRTTKFVTPTWQLTPTNLISCGPISNDGLTMYVPGYAGVEIFGTDKPGGLSWKSVGNFELDANSWGGSALSHDGAYLYLGYNSNPLRILTVETATGNAVTTALGDPSTYVRSLALDPIRNRLYAATGAYSNHITTLEITGDPAKPLEQIAEPIESLGWSMTVSPDGRHIYVSALPSFRRFRIQDDPANPVVADAQSSDPGWNYIGGVAASPTGATVLGVSEPGVAESGPIGVITLLDAQSLSPIGDVWRAAESQGFGPPWVSPLGHVYLQVTTDVHTAARHVALLEATNFDPDRPCPPPPSTPGVKQ